MATKNTVPQAKNTNTLPLLLLGMAGLQLWMAALSVSAHISADKPIMYGVAAAALGLLGLLRAAVPPVVRRWAVWAALAVLVSVPVLAVFGGWLGLDLLPLPLIYAAPLLVLVAVLIRPDTL
ncbi:hypothetical protein Dxin01_03899 [Deinococcus xinjiangensis]|uniref:Integral membrane protein n=1 Tax=Deinococcus xinjiangensis TaxID=457454 RepID=A0ABP9VHS7_9DEIO